MKIPFVQSYCVNVSRLQPVLHAYDGRFQSSCRISGLIGVSRQRTPSAIRQNAVEFVRRKVCSYQAVHDFRIFLYGRNIRILSERQPLKSLKNSGDPSSRLAR